MPAHAMATGRCVAHSEGLSCWAEGTPCCSLMKKHEKMVK